jgi:putative spermidine/putrescine transport system permease protein
VAQVRRRVSITAIVWLVFGALYLVVPLFAMAKFSVENGFLGGYTTSAYREILDDPQFRHTLWVSAQLAIETTILSLALMIPTVYWVHLKLPRLRPLLEFIAVLPIVVPAIVLVIGLSDFYQSAPDWFFGTTRFLVVSYVILSLTFVFFALDQGMRAIDIHTLTEAAASLGASRRTTLFRVILPNLRTAALSAALLTIAVVMGEFTIANILLFNTFPTYIYYIGQTKANPAAALSLISFAILFVAMLALLLLARGQRGLRPGGAR